MRIAAFSDVHGDADRLRRVLTRIEGERPDIIANLGDAFAGDLFPREVAELIGNLPMVTVRGNHERIMAGPVATMPRRDRAAVEALGEGELKWIRQLRPTARPRPDVLLVHGSPRDDTIGILETATPAGLRAATDAEIAERLDGYDSRLVLCGHTHVPRIYRRPCGQLIVCPGSVHRPLIRNNSVLAAAGADAACYAIATDERGHWRAELVLVNNGGSCRYSLAEPKMD